MTKKEQEDKQKDTSGWGLNFDGLELRIQKINSEEEEIMYLNDKEAKQLRDYLIDLYGLPEGTPLFSDSVK